MQQRAISKESYFIISSVKLYVVTWYPAARCYNGFKYGDWSPTRIQLAPGRIINNGSDLEQQGSE